MTSRLVRTAGAAASLTLIATLAACGSDNNAKSSTATTAAGTATTGGAGAVACASGTVSGAGSTFVQTLAAQWIKDYEAACPGSTINYQGVGSGAGIQQFTAGTVDFGASDAVMKPAEEQAAVAKGGAVLQVPWAAGGIAVMYKLNGVKDLQLSPETLAGIYAGTVKKWNDPKIVTDNPSAQLPPTGIQVVHRSDGSGTTNAFTTYLTAVAPTVWSAGAGKDVPWPTGQGAKGSDGVTSVVQSTEGAIGYAELSFAKANGIDTAKLKNGAGTYVAPTPDAVKAALASATVPANLKVQINNKPTDPAAYPLSTATWAIVFVKPGDGAKARLLKDFLLYAVTKGQTSATSLSYAPIPADLASKDQDAINTIQSA